MLAILFISWGIANIFNFCFNYIPLLCIWHKHWLEVNENLWTRDINNTLKMNTIFAIYNCNICAF